MEVNIESIKKGYARAENIWTLDKEIKCELPLLLIISSFCAKTGSCFASNEYLGKIFDEHPVNISKKINKLIKKNYITAEYIKEGSKVKKRILRLVNSLTDRKQICYPTVSKNAKDISKEYISDKYIKEEIYKEEKKNFFKIKLSHEAIDDIKEFTRVIQEWVDYKKARKNMYKTQIGFEKFVKKLIEYSNGECEKAQEIIDISIANNYQGIFPLKGRV